MKLFSSLILYIHTALMIDWKSLDIWMHKKLLTKMAASISYFLAFKKEVVYLEREDQKRIEETLI